MLCTNPALSAMSLHVNQVWTAALDNRISQFCPARKPDVKERELNQKSPNPYLVRIAELILSLTKHNFNLSVVRTAGGWYNPQCNYIVINLLTIAASSLNFELRGGGTQVFWSRSSLKLENLSYIQSFVLSKLGIKNRAVLTERHIRVNLPCSAGVGVRSGRAWRAAVLPGNPASRVLPDAAKQKGDTGKASGELIPFIDWSESRSHCLVKTLCGNYDAWVFQVLNDFISESRTISRWKHCESADQKSGKNL